MSTLFQGEATVKMVNGFTEWLEEEMKYEEELPDHEEVNYEFPIIAGVFEKPFCALISDKLFTQIQSV